MKTDFKQGVTRYTVDPQGLLVESQRGGFVRYADYEALASSFSKTQCWIPVGERPPDDEQRVLGYYPDPDDPQGSAETLTYYASDAPDGPECWYDRCGVATDAPSHWKPWEAPK